MSYLEKCKPVRSAQLLIFCLASLCALSGLGCRSSPTPGNSQGGSGTAANVTSSIPPYPTKEPERYQATRIVTFSESSSNPANVSPQERITRVWIARDGEKRREEYLDRASEQVVYLEIPAGRFVLLPGSSLYADLSAMPNESGSGDESSELSPDLLLNEEYSAATYENLGGAMLDGRMTTKYRVTPGNRNNETVAKVETFVWVDESVGLPVRSETISSAGELSAKVTMELKDIKLEADERLFALPANYQKVNVRFILDRIRGVRKLAVPEVEKK